VRTTANVLTVAMNSAGNLLIGDGEANRIRMVDGAGLIRTLAGNGEVGFGGDTGPASDALFFLPTAAVTDKAGNLLIADSGNHRMRRVDTGGTITTIAGIGGTNFSGVGGPAVLGTLGTFMTTDASGNLIFSQLEIGRVRKLDTQGILTTVAGNGTTFVFAGDGGSAVNAAINPTGVAMDALVICL
jgi:sugar lactone lactonase YvrE